MSNVRECLILAAGNGSRMRSVSGPRPKPLMEFRGSPILEQVVRRASRAGIERFTITVGYRSDLIRQWFARCRLDDISVRIVENRDYH
jgi:NDP-sugar pyrophosphorylase family protein